MRSTYPLAVGFVAILDTAAFVALQAILAASAPHAEALRTSAIISTAIQGTTIILLSILSVGYAAETFGAPVRRYMNLFMGLGIVTSTLAAAASVATLVLLSRHAGHLDHNVMGISQVTMLIVSAVLVGTAYPLQVLFVILQFIVGRKSDSTTTASIFQRVKSPNSGSKLKAIPYSHTSVSIGKRQGSNSIDAPSVSTSVAGRKSGVETSGSMSSCTRLLPLWEKRRPASPESMANRSSTEDTFESWDTSCVDVHTRQTVLEVSSSPPPTQKPPRFLETIPASPTGSRSPSPSCSVDLPLPRLARRRSRSYSPTSSRRASFTSTPNTSEAHIHPLFRSDSTEPPPVASPGTSVVASPIAGQVISPRPSMRSLRRIRSGSLPVASSPLSRQSSFEDAVMRRLQDEQRSIKEESEEDGLDEDDSDRKMTPPIPDWIMSADSRTSLSGYKRRVLKDGESKTTSPEPRSGS
ncbi:hypothetical protein NLU13_3102 [Sarocladium strictum]|uniref:Uncharacterized protein n=1 Tax=Sarocladium strictum TaxID=5046 RepID=A0AA39GLF1_SARSR|nr:hypothetical protein NLU13_3102 [Sarocladium strictum]